MRLFEERLRAEELNRLESMKRFPAEVRALHDVCEALADFPSQLRPIAREGLAVAAGLFQMAGDSLDSAALSALAAKGVESMMFLRKAAEAIAIANQVGSDHSAAEIYVKHKSTSDIYRTRFKRSRLFPEGSAVRARLLKFYDLTSNAGTHANLEGFINRRSVIPGDGGNNRLRYGVFDADEQWVRRYLMYATIVGIEIYATNVEIFQSCLASEARTADVLETLRKLHGGNALRYAAELGLGDDLASSSADVAD